MSSESRTTIVGERIEKFLRTRHPAKTADNVSADTGCSRAQVLKWLERSSVPNGVALLRLMSAYGPEFLSAVMGERAPRWLDDAWRAERIRDLAARQAGIEDELRAIDAR